MATYIVSYKIKGLPGEVFEKVECGCEDGAVSMLISNKLNDGIDIDEDSVVCHQLPKK